MAQVIDYYTSSMNSRWYIYPDAYTMEGGVQYEAGTSLRLPANYGERETNGRYPVTSPMSGWLNFTYFNAITPVYKTITDACTAPTNVTINTSTKVMTITGGAGGDLNTFEGFGIQWRERDITGTTWGSWSTETVTASRTVSVTVNAGKVRQYRVRTRGSAGSSYYSAYVNCATLLSGNTAAAAPTILLPAAEAVTASQTPVVVVSCSADNEGDQMTLQRKIDSGSYAAVTTVGGSGGTVYDKLPTLANGRHTITYRVVDVNGGTSGEKSVAIVVGRAAWARTIASGTIIANATISHVADINELLNAVNVQRMYYGLATIKLPGTVGRFVDWGRQMDALLKGTNECLAAAGQPVTASDVSDVWPNAATINTIRNQAVMV